MPRALVFMVDFPQEKVEKKETRQKLMRGAEDCHRRGTTQQEPAAAAVLRPVSGSTTSTSL